MSLRWWRESVALNQSEPRPGSLVAYWVVRQAVRPWVPIVCLPAPIGRTSCLLFTIATRSAPGCWLASPSAQVSGRKTCETSCPPRVAEGYRLAYGALRAGGAASRAHAQTEPNQALQLTASSLVSWDGLGQAMVGLYASDGGRIDRSRRLERST
jgi:hypothetical protein